MLAKYAKRQKASAGEMGHELSFGSSASFALATGESPGEPDWIDVSNSRKKTERTGEVKSTKVSNKYDLLDDVETNVKAEIDEEEDEKKGKEKGAEKESSVHALPRHTNCPAPLLDIASRAPQFESVSPESVGGNGKAPRGSTPLTTDSVLAACILTPDSLCRPPWMRPSRLDALRLPLRQVLLDKATVHLLHRGDWSGLLGLCTLFVRLWRRLGARARRGRDPGERYGLPRLRHCGRVTW